MKKLILLIPILLVLISCQKDEALKQPTSLSFSFVMEENDIDFFYIDNGIIFLDNFDINGDRVEGEDINFDRNFDEPNLFSFGYEQSVAKINLDLPQGVYNRINIGFETFMFEGDIEVGYDPNYIAEAEDGEDTDEEEDEEGDEEEDEEGDEEEDEEESEDEEDEEDEWDEEDGEIEEEETDEYLDELELQDYLDTDKYSMVFEGWSETYELPIRIEFYASELFKLDVEDVWGEKEIVLDKEHPAKGEIIIDPWYWFENVPEELWEEAETVAFNGEETLIISEFINTEIYALIAYRVPNSISVQIK
jgi:hypothetical protein